MVNGGRTKHKKLARLASRSLLVASCLFSLITCPYSKVEESFNLQATHDLLYYGIGPAWQSWRRANNESTEVAVYDHLQYPGVVPRTFAGPIILSTGCRFVAWFTCPFMDLYQHPMEFMFLARLFLLCLNLHAWIRISKALSSTNNNNNSMLSRSNSTEYWFLLIMASQFHLPFYASRMLPNTFAMILTSHAFADWLLYGGRNNYNIQLALVYIVLATLIFRCDMVLLLATMGLTWWLVTKQITLVKALQVGIVATIPSLTFTVPIDSLLWGRLVWPEAEVFYYNAILGKSSDWGIMAWHWYVTNAIPKAMLLTLVLVPCGLFQIPNQRLDTTACIYLGPIVAFVGLYSCLGHKEVRFLFPILPMLNVIAAIGLSRLQQAYCLSRTTTASSKDKTIGSFSKVVKLAMFAGGVLAVVVTAFASIMFVLVSKHNYPGGVALQQLVQHLSTTTTQPSNISHATLRIHVDVASSMTGVSLFGQTNAKILLGNNVEFTKLGFEEENQSSDYSNVTHVLSETKNGIIPGFHVVSAAQGHPRFDVQTLQITTQDAIYVLERDNL